MSYGRFLSPVGQEKQLGKEKQKVVFSEDDGRQVVRRRHRLVRRCPLSTAARDFATGRLTRYRRPND